MNLAVTFQTDAKALFLIFVSFMYKIIIASLYLGSDYVLFLLLRLTLGETPALKITKTVTDFFVVLVVVFQVTTGAVVALVATWRSVKKTLTELA